MVKRLVVYLVAVVMLTGCSKPPAQAPRPRIISYSPSVTDILIDLGLEQHLVGVTSWCMLPAGVTKPIVGSESAINTETVLELAPDLIFVQQKTEKFDPLLKRLPSCRVVSVKTDSVEGVLQSIRTIGQEVDKAGPQPLGAAEKSEKLSAGVRRHLEEIRRKAPSRRPRVLFVMGHDHPYTTGRDTFLHELIEIAGGVNAAGESYTGWKSINLEVILALAPEVLICQTTPTEEGAARTYWNALKDLPAVKAGKVIVTTDRRLTIFGSRIGDSAQQLALWMHGASGTAAPAISLKTARAAAMMLCLQDPLPLPGLIVLSEDPIAYITIGPPRLQTGSPLGGRP